MGFLFQILHKMGFGPRFHELVAILLSTTSTRVLLNGEPDIPFGIGGASYKVTPPLASVIRVSHEHA
jgi:hypothetical protein